MTRARWQPSDYLEHGTIYVLLLDAVSFGWTNESPYWLVVGTSQTIAAIREVAAENEISEPQLLAMIVDRATEARHAPRSRQSSQKG